MRPTRTKRDHKAAAPAATKIAGRPHRESSAELRLRARISEMEKFDEADDDIPEISAEESGNGPRRRWSDDTPDPD